MCQVTIYKDEKKLMEEVSEFTLDVESGTLTAYSLSTGEKREFAPVKKVTWRELDDSLVVE
ncbi:hypothetical protein H5U35_09610 [Candidatus Aerophobetes bacterium]|nr:hypothetical protein [Candidatus Aerophobetes bacterium]